MKPLFVVALAALAGSSAFAQPTGAPLAVQFTVEAQDDPAKVQLAISRRERGNHWMHSNTRPLAELEGLSGAELGSASGGPIRFRVHREAGTLDCEGVARRGRGTGECGFTPNTAFTAALRQRGIGEATPMQLFSMAMGRVGLAYVQELERQRYVRPTVDDLVRAGDHGAGLDYLRAMGALGYRPGTVAALVRMRDHGVTPDYVREMVELGIRDVPAEDLVRLRDHGVSPKFVAELRQLGYRDLPLNELIRLRDHGVTPTYLRELAGHGVRRLPTADLIRLRSHGVSADFVGELRTLGYGDLSADELIRLRIHGVSPAFIRRANAGGRRSVDELVRQRISG